MFMPARDQTWAKFAQVKIVKNKSKGESKKVKNKKVEVKIFMPASDQTWAKVCTSENAGEAH